MSMILHWFVDLEACSIILAKKIIVPSSSLQYLLYIIHILIERELIVRCCRLVAPKHSLISL